MRLLSQTLSRATSSALRGNLRLSHRVLHCQAVSLQAGIFNPKPPLQRDFYRSFFPQPNKPPPPLKHTQTYTHVPTIGSGIGFLTKKYG